MSIIVVLVIVSLCLAVGFLIAFLWAVRSGQFEDTYTPSVRVLMDHKGKQEKPENKDK
jgi:cbb3-type cytochrome oxidase maturation protein